MSSMHAALLQLCSWDSRARHQAASTDNQAAAILDLIGRKRTRRQHSTRQAHRSPPGLIQLAGSSLELKSWLLLAPSAHAHCRGVRLPRTRHRFPTFFYKCVIFSKTTHVPPENSSDLGLGRRPKPKYENKRGGTCVVSEICSANIHKNIKSAPFLGAEPYGSPHTGGGRAYPGYHLPGCVPGVCCTWGITELDPAPGAFITAPGVRMLVHSTLRRYRYDSPAVTYY